MSKSNERSESTYRDNDEVLEEAVAEVVHIWLLAHPAQAWPLCKVLRNTRICVEKFFENPVVMSKGRRVAHEPLTRGQTDHMCMEQ
jgi:hypothetical protein